MSLMPTPGTAVEAKVINDPWYPDIDLAQLRATCRLDGTVTSERLRHAVIGAMATCNQQLSAWAVRHTLAGVTHLEDVPCPELDGKPQSVQLYLRAVYAAAMCELVERYRDYDPTARADKRGELAEPRIDELRRDLRWALSDLQGLRRVTVELI
jgi:hypothetical protein